MRLHRGVAERVEGELGGEVQILVLADVHLAREVLHRRDTSVEIAELSDPHGIRTIEDVPLPDRKLRLGPRRRQEVPLRTDRLPERDGVRASGKTATYADDRYGSVHLLELYQKQRGAANRRTQHPNPEFFGIIYPGFSRDPRKHGPRNISRPLKNRPRLSETPVDAVETRLLMGPQLARSPLFQAGLRAWPDGRTFQPPSQCSPHPFARPSSPAPTSSPATGGTRFRPQSAGRASAGPAAGAPSSSVSR